MPAYDATIFDPPAPMAHVTLRNLDRNMTLRGRFLLIEQGWGILGRNILNALPILLDGPRLAWEER